MSAQVQVLVALLYQIPEGMMVALAGLGLFGIHNPTKRIVLLGVLYGLSVSLIRAIGLPPGVHTFLLLACFVLLALFLVRPPILIAFSAWVLSAFLISLGEQIIIAPLMRLLELDLQTMLSSPLSHIGWGWLSALPLLSMTIYVRLTRFTLIPPPRKSSSNSTTS